MAVGSKWTGNLLPVKGVRSAAVAAGIRYPNRLDLVLFELAEGSKLSGVFTRNAFCAAPVTVARKHLDSGDGRYLLINTGNANAGTGTRGVADALACCEEVARYASESVGTPIATHQVLPFSTGVIGEHLPTQRIVESVPRAMSGLEVDSWDAAARGIMTTDTRPKAVSSLLTLPGGEQIAITGIAKGAGMIKPNMATMLAFVFTDASIEQALLDRLLGDAINQSFNRITVDGDTSTNDGCLLVATAGSAQSIEESRPDQLASFQNELNAVFRQLAMELIRDAEGATKFVTVKVAGGADTKECLAVAYTIAESPLVKTALFASDPNWGRILAAIGRAGLENLDIEKISIRLGQVLLVENGGVAASYAEQRGQAEMDQDEITISVDLARGSSEETVWTSDLSHDYVRINAEYRT
jgi:glutamate N-acetyltransferase/amino-acid N-acetyltransferase